LQCTDLDMLCDVTESDLTEHGIAAFRARQLIKKLKNEDGNQSDSNNNSSAVSNALIQIQTQNVLIAVDEEKERNDRMVQRAMDRRRREVNRAKLNEDLKDNEMDLEIERLKKDKNNEIMKKKN